MRETKLCNKEFVKRVGVKNGSLIAFAVLSPGKRASQWTGRLEELGRYEERAVCVVYYVMFIRAQGPCTHGH